MRDGGDVDLRVVVRERVETGVVAEGPFENQRFRRIDVTLENDLASEAPQVAGDRLREVHRLSPQKSGEQELVDRGRQRRRRRIDAGRVAPEGDDDRHALAPSAISRQCAAPTLWRCQCIASSFGFRCTWIRYIPTFRMPRDGSSVITIGSVM
jgi:hypothetical protein